VIDNKLSRYFSAMGRKSTKARMKKLSAEQRSEIARNAAKSRWAKNGKRKAKKRWGRETMMDNLKRAAIYVRVSTAEQETDLQEHELKEYCGRRGWNYVAYRDRGQSGAKNDRPALTAMMNDLRRRKIDVIVVWALDRLARSLKQLLSISEECRSVSVDLVSLKQNVDTTLPAGRLTFQVLGAVAEFEREMLRERVKAGMAQARRSGKHIGRPALRKFLATEIQKMKLLRSQGTSVRKLATAFGTTQWMAARLTDSEPERLTTQGSGSS
jgi:DNA invertase Pin-like site-specific DNA recombinase